MKAVFVAVIVYLSFNLSGFALASDVVGAIDADFSVDPFGAAVYDIPIDVPAGRGGLKPGISLQYNSQHGQAIAGMGWSVAGLSEISRCSQTVPQDGGFRGVQYDSSDRFCLDGRRMLVYPEFSYGAQEAEYTTERYDFDKILSHGSVSGGPESFEVVRKNGERHFYGATDDARLSTADGVVYKWALSRIEDQFGNAISYRYTKRAVSGSYAGFSESAISTVTTREQDVEQLISTVEYSGSDNLFQYRIRFNYVDRVASEQRFGSITKLSSSMSGSGVFDGVVWQQTKLLSEVVFEHRPHVSDVTYETVHRYSLQYDPAPTHGGQALLVSVTKCGPSLCLPATTFEWDRTSSGWSGEPLLLHDHLSFPQVSLTDDFNGDGKAEVVVPDGVSGSLINSNVLGEGGGVWERSSASLSSSSAILDIDGDGRSDMFAGIGGGNYRVQLSANGFSTTQYQMSAGIDFEILGSFNSNNDGLGDIYAVDTRQNDYQVYLFENQGVAGHPFDLSTAPVISFHRANEGEQFYLQSGDFDGDSVSDFLAVRCGHYVGCSFDFFDANGRIAASFKLPHVIVPTVFDANGDGISDLFLASENRTYGAWLLVTLGFSDDGRYLASKAEHPELAGWGLSAVATDFNRDGQQDLLHPSGSLLISDGASLTGSAADAYNINELANMGVGYPGDSANRVLLSDLTGDGYDDLIVVVVADLLEGHLVVVPEYRSQGTRITRITDGLGNIVEPVYANLREVSSDIYSSSGIEPGAGYVEFREDLFVVTEYQLNDGTAQNNSYSYNLRYGDAINSIDGREFRGFRTVASRDSRSGIETETEYLLEFPFDGHISSELVRDAASNALVRTSDYFWTVRPGIAGEHIVEQEEKRIDEYEVTGTAAGALIRRTTHTYEYEPDYHFLVKETIRRSPGEALFVGYVTVKETVPFDPVLAESWGCVGLASELRESRSNAWQIVPEVRVTQFRDYRDDCVPRIKIDASDNNTEKQLIETRELDDYGNVVAVTRSNVADSVDFRRTSYTYDDWGSRAVEERRHISGESDHIYTLQWDNRFGVVEFDDKPGKVSSAMRYDELGRIMRLETGDGTYVDMTFTPCTNCTSRAATYFIGSGDSKGLDTIIEYDSYGREVARKKELLATQGALRVVETVYDAIGRVTAVSKPSVEAEAMRYFSRYEYDVLNRKTKSVEPLSDGEEHMVTEYIYSANQVEEVFNGLSSRVLRKDPLGRVMNISDAAGIRLFRYNAFGQVVSVTSPEGQTIKSTYDSRGYLRSTNDPDRGVREFDHNVYGELELLALSPENHTIVQYDELGRVVSRDEAEGQTYWQYSVADGAKGLPESVSMSSGFIESYDYDDFGRTTGVTTTIDQVSYTTNYAYDSQGRISRVVYPRNTGPWGGGVRQTYDYSYGANGYLVEVNNGRKSLYQALSINPFGSVELAKYGNEYRETGFYSASGKTRSIRTGITEDSADIQSLSYSWHATGTLHSRSNDAAGSSLYEEFFYDEGTSAAHRNRLTSVALNGEETLRLSYESSGNISVKSDVPGNYVYSGESAGPHAVTSIESAGKYAYDDHGNMRERPDASLIWTSFGKVREINAATDSMQFDYGPDRRRVKQVSGNESTVFVGKHFRVDRVGEETRYTAKLLVNDEVIHVSWVKDAFGADWVGEYFIHRDHLGSLDKLTDGNGAVVASYSFDAFGRRRGDDWSTPYAVDELDAPMITDRGFTGHQHLDQFGLVNMNGRMYDPLLGRMISPDPLIADMQRGAAYNRYSYVENNPLSLVDPSGYTPEQYISPTSDGGIEEIVVTAKRGVPLDSSASYQYSVSVDRIGTDHTAIAARTGSAVGHRTTNSGGASAGQDGSKIKPGTKAAGWLRPDGHNYVVGRDTNLLFYSGKKGLGIGSIIDDYFPAGHTFGTNHDAFVDLMVEDYGLSDTAVNIPSMIPVYIYSLGQEIINTPFRAVDSVFGTSSVPFEHSH